MFITTTLESKFTSENLTMEIFEPVTTPVIGNQTNENDLNEDNVHKLDVSQLVIFVFIGASCLAAVIVRRFVTTIKQLCGFRLSRSESAKQSKKCCNKDEDDF